MSTKLERGLTALKAQIDAPIASFFSSCVHCGICAEACLFFTETGDPRYTPIHKTEPMRKLWSQEYTFWGKIASKLGLRKPLTEEDFADWEMLVYDGCSMCGRCSMVCPLGVDIAYIIRKVKEGLSAAGYSPEDLVEAGERARTIGSPMGVTVKTLEATIRVQEKEHGLEIPDLLVGLAQHVEAVEHHAGEQHLGHAQPDAGRVARGRAGTFVDGMLGGEHDQSPGNQNSSSSVLPVTRASCTHRFSVGL